MRAKVEKLLAMILCIAMLLNTVPVLADGTGLNPNGDEVVTPSEPSIGPEQFTIPLGDRIDGQLNGNAHRCYVTLPSDGELYLKFGNPYGGQVRFYLYDASDTCLDSATIGTTIRGWLDAGTYYVLVTSNALDEYYWISASFTATNSVESKRNNTIASATPLSADGNYRRGVLTWQDEVDYYSINVESAGELTIQFTTTTRSTDFAILDAYGRVIDEFKDSYGEKYKTDVAAGTYYIRFKRVGVLGTVWDFTYGGDYDVKASFEPAASTDAPTWNTDEREVDSVEDKLYIEYNVNSGAKYVRLDYEGYAADGTLIEKDVIGVYPAKKHVMAPVSRYKYALPGEISGFELPVSKLYLTVCDVAGNSLSPTSEALTVCRVDLLEQESETSPESVTLTTSHSNEVVEGTEVSFSIESNSESVTLYIDAFNGETGERYNAVTKEMDRDGASFTASNRLHVAGKKIIWAVTADGVKSNEIEINVVPAPVKLGTPEYTGMTTGTVGSASVFSWNAVADAAGYTAQIRPANDLQNVTDLTGLINGQEVSCTFSAPGDYYLQIFAVGTEGYGASDPCNVTVTVTEPTESCQHENYGWRENGKGKSTRIDNHKHLYTFPVIYYCTVCGYEWEGYETTEGEHTLRTKTEYDPKDADFHYVRKYSVCSASCGVKKLIDEDTAEHTPNGDGKCTACDYVDATEGTITAPSPTPSVTVRPTPKPGSQDDENNNSIIGDLLALLLGASESSAAEFGDTPPFSMYYRYASDDVDVFYKAPAKLTYTAAEAAGKTLTLWGVSAKEWVQPDQHRRYEMHITDTQDIIKDFGKHDIEGVFTGDIGVATFAIYDTEAKRYICSVIVEVVVDKKSQEVFDISLSYEDDAGELQYLTLKGGGDVHIVSAREIVPVTIKVWNESYREKRVSYRYDGVGYARQRKDANTDDLYARKSGDTDRVGIGQEWNLTRGDQDRSDATIKFWVRGAKPEQDYVAAVVHLTVERQSAYPERYNLQMQNVNSPQDSSDIQTTVYTDASSPTVTFEFYACDTYEPNQKKLNIWSNFSEFDLYVNGSKHTGKAVWERGTYNVELLYRDVTVDWVTIRVVSSANRLEEIDDDDKYYGEGGNGTKFNITQSCVWVNDDFEYITAFEDDPNLLDNYMGLNPHIDEQYLAGYIAPSHILLLTPKDAMAFANILSTESANAMTEAAVKYLGEHVGEIFDASGEFIGGTAGEIVGFYGNMAEYAAKAVVSNPSDIVVDVMKMYIYAACPPAKIAELAFEAKDLVELIGPAINAYLSDTLAVDIRKHAEKGMGVSIVWGYGAAEGKTICRVYDSVSDSSRIQEWKYWFNAPIDMDDTPITGYVVKDAEFISDVWSETLEYYR